MALSADDVAAIDALLGGPDADSDALAQMRRRFPALSLTQCDASDIDHERPFRDYPRFRVFLVDGARHCWTLTGDPARATGLVVVERKVARA